MQDQLKTIREACIKANPSILDLVFGCIFIDTQNDRNFLMHNENGQLISYAWCGDIHSFPEIYGNMSDEEKKRYRIKRFGINEDGKYEDIYEIIGRKIGIAEILVAIKDTGYYFDPQYSNFQSKDKTEAHPFTHYNLLDDDITYQSPECIAFIANLLGNEAGK